MKHFYTINYKLFACVRNDENLIDAQTADLAYKTRQKALQGVQERIKTYIELCGYERSMFNPMVLFSKDGDFKIEFEIKEHWLSDYEKES